MSIWFTSDTHFSHSNILTFKDGEGMHIRKGFSNADEMNELMIQKWNECVKPGDKIWHLGDVTFGHLSDFNRVIHRLNGQKRLCLGNHDDIKRHELFSHFEKIQLWRMFKDEGFTCTHVPLPPDQFRYKTKLNVHGHIHEKPDPSIHHMNICVEKTDYRPLHMDEIVAEISKRGL